MAFDGFEAWLLCCQPLPAPKPYRSPQYPGWGDKEVDTLAMTRIAGETRYPLTTLSPSTTGEFVGQVNLSRLKAVLPRGGAE